MSYRFLIVGAGFSGSVLARELVSQIDCDVEVWEARDHVAGNCYTSTDEETGITIHRYGPHIFNTDKKEIWDYFNKFSSLRPYVHQVKAFHKGQLYPMPVNLNTLNQFFGRDFTPEAARALLEQAGDATIAHPQNFEEQAIRFLGKKLYEAFFYGYTKKQWGCEPRKLPASVLKRIPVRFDYDNNYHRYPYTGIPEKGYTDFVDQLIRHPRIRLILNRKFTTQAEISSRFDHLFYTGPIDRFFNEAAGRLSYRTLRFEKVVSNGDFQHCAQVNYCDLDVPYTRITEHKHFTPWKKFARTVIFKEYSSEAGKDDILYYPKRLRADKEMFEKYRSLAAHTPGVSFLGRLGTYRYLDMQHVIAEAIALAEKVSVAFKNVLSIPVFPD